MPEGDVLRWTAARLDRALAGRQITETQLRWPSAAGVTFDGRTVLGSNAYGKHLFTRFDDGRTLHTHLRMDGVWRIRDADDPARSVRIRAVLRTTGSTALGIDLGMLDVVPTRSEHELIAHLGPDLLAEDFVDRLPHTLLRWAGAGRTPVAEVLLDQTVVAGIGTIFAAETLYARRTWPWTPAAEVDEPASVLMTARELMLRSVSGAGATGRPRQPGRVHGRQGMPCRRCGSSIRRGQARRPPMERPIFYCPRCQSPTGNHAAIDR